VEIELFVYLQKSAFQRSVKYPFTIIHLKRLLLKFYVHSGFIIPERERERERETVNSEEEEQEKILNEKFQTQISFLN